MGGVRIGGLEHTADVLANIHVAAGALGVGVHGNLNSYTHTHTHTSARAHTMGKSIRAVKRGGKMAASLRSAVQYKASHSTH